MQEFITEHQALVWVIFVLFVTTLLYYAFHFGFNFLSKRLADRGYANLSLLQTLRRILKTFIVIFGIGLISYVFFEKEMYDVINQNMLRVLWIAVVALVTVIAAAVVQNFFSNRISATSRRDQQDVTTYKYLNYLATFFIYLLGLVLVALAIPPLRDFAASALAGAGVLALIVGVAAQEAFSNLIGGLFIAFFKPFRIGDIIKVGADIVGRVEDLTLRHTVINDFQNKRIVIPNAIVNKENITNYYLGEYKCCEWVEIGISYDSNIDKAMAIMQEEAENHPKVLDNRTPKERQDGVPKVDVQVIGLGDSSVNLRAWVWAATYITGFRMRNDLFKSIKQRFDKEGIEIPFPHRVVVMKNSEKIEKAESPMH